MDLLKIISIAINVKYKTQKIKNNFRIFAGKFFTIKRNFYIMESKEYQTYLAYAVYLLACEYQIERYCFCINDVGFLVYFVLEERQLYPCQHSGFKQEKYYLRSEKTKPILDILYEKNLLSLPDNEYGFNHAVTKYKEEIINIFENDYDSESLSIIDNILKSIDGWPLYFIAKIHYAIYTKGIYNLYDLCNEIHHIRKEKFISDRNRDDVQRAVDSILLNDKAWKKHYEWKKMWKSIGIE